MMKIEHALWVNDLEAMKEILPRPIFQPPLTNVITILRPALARTF